MDLEHLIEQAVELPDAVVAGASVLQTTAYEESGQAHSVVVLTLLFSVSDVHVGQQNFVLDADLAGQLRRALKNPPQYRYEDITEPIPNPNTNQPVQEDAE